jgi:cysteine-rich repeat protein
MMVLREKMVRFALCRAVVMGGASLCGTSVLVAGCGSSGPGTTVPDGATSDAAPVADAGTGRDGNTTVDANDASAGPCAACEPSSPCETAECIDDICVREPLEEGTSCGEASICVASECVERGCGDGYVEPGPTPPREQCDPGAGTPNDGCSSTCEAEMVSIYAPSTLDPEQRWAAPAVGVDGDGRVLFTWTVQESETSPKLLMGRIGTGGEPFEIGRGFTAYRGTWAHEFHAGEPTVLGLEVGWVVAWPQGETYAPSLRYRMVAPDGSLSTVETPHEAGARASHPRMAALPDGFVMGWESAVLRDNMRIPQARARRFADDGTPLGPVMELDSATEQQQASVDVASQGTEWIAVWLRADPSEPSDGVATIRRFDGADATDDEPIELQDERGHPGGLTDIKVHWGRAALPAFTYARSRRSDDGLRFSVLDVDGELHFRINFLGWYGRRYLHSAAPLGDGLLVQIGPWPGSPRPSDFFPHRVTSPEELATFQALHETDLSGRVRVFPGDDGVWMTWGSYPDVLGDGLKAFHITHP